MKVLPLSGTAFDEHAKLTPTVDPEVFCPLDEMTEAARERLAVGQLAARIVLGLSDKGLRETAQENGISAQRLSKQCHTLAVRLGWDWSLLSQNHCAQLATAQRERWRKRKAANGVQTAAAIVAKKETRQGTFPHE